MELLETVYFECYEGEKLIHIDRSLQDPEEMKAYLEEFPERTIKRIDKEFYHTIKIYDSQDATYCHACKYVGKIKVKDKDFYRLIQLPHLGCGTDPVKGCYSMTFAKIHIKKVMGFSEPLGQLSLFDF